MPTPRNLCGKLETFFRKKSIDKIVFQKPFARSISQGSSHTRQVFDAAIFTWHVVNVLSNTFNN